MVSFPGGPEGERNGVGSEGEGRLAVQGWGLESVGSSDGRLNLEQFVFGMGLSRRRGHIPR